MNKNIFLFVADQMRCDAMAHMGNPAAITPHLDDLCQRVYRLQMHIARIRFAYLPGTAF